MPAKKMTKKAKPARKISKKTAKTTKKVQKRSAAVKKASKTSKKVVFSSKIREQQRQTIYQTVAARDDKATFLQLKNRMLKKYPTMLEYTVRNIIDGLVEKKHLRKLKVPNSRALNYGIGRKPL